MGMFGKVVNQLQINVEGGTTDLVPGAPLRGNVFLSLNRELRYQKVVISLAGWIHHIAGEISDLLVSYITYLQVPPGDAPEGVLPARDYTWDFHFTIPDNALPSVPEPYKERKIEYLLVRRSWAMQC